MMNIVHLRITGAVYYTPRIVYCNHADSIERLLDTNVCTFPSKLDLIPYHQTKKK